MTVNKDLVTTVVGVIGAVAGAANPVLQATNTGTIDNQGITQLILSIVVAIIGFFTGRPQAEKP